MKTFRVLLLAALCTLGASSLMPSGLSSVRPASASDHLVATLTPQAYLPLVAGPPASRPPSGCNFSDDFSNPASGWPSGIEGNGGYTYLNGKYIVQMDGSSSPYTYRKVNHNTWCDNFQASMDFAAVVDPGSDYAGTWGLLFRYLDDNNYYSFNLAWNGTDLFYYVTKRVNGVETVLGGIYSVIAYSQDRQVHNLKVIADGNRISVLRDASLLASYFDSSLSAGYTGFVSFVGSGGSPITYLELDNFAQSSPPSGWVNKRVETFEGQGPGQFPNDWALYSSANGYTFGRSDCRAFEGSYSLWAVGGGSSASPLPCGSNYPDNTSALMVYGPFSLETATAARVNFKMWLNTPQNPTGPTDTLCVGASTDGTTWSGVRCAYGNSGGWVDAAFDLVADVQPAGLLGQPRVWLVFQFYSDASVNLPEGAYLDNIELKECVTTSCPPVSSPAENPHLRFAYPPPGAPITIPPPPQSKLELYANPEG